MVVNLVLYLTLGMLLGVGIAIGLADSYLRDTLLRRILKSNKDGWVLEQAGNRLSLLPLERQEDSGIYTVNGSEGKRYKEDVGLMTTWHGVPVGLSLEESRPMVDVEAATAAERASEKLADGGTISETTQLDAQDLIDRVKIGQKHGRNRSIVYCNPFIALKESPDLVDLRHITKLLRYESQPDAPRKSAKNAKEAERAFDSYAGAKKTIGLLGAAMVGGILTYIGTTSGGGGGGGGGGGVDVPVSLATDMMLAVM
jgi:hypothetical protein